MARIYKITRPRARLEAQLVVDPSFSPGFALVRYEDSRGNARWWQRTIVATDGQWLRLSGRDQTNPADTWSDLLNDHHRRTLPLPLLVLTDFIAHAENHAQSQSQWLFYWVAWALDDLLRLSPLPPSRMGGTSTMPELIDNMAHRVMEALIAGNLLIPWPTTDGAQLQTLIRIGEIVWSFPPALVRQLVNSFVTLNQRDMRDAVDPDDRQDAVDLGDQQVEDSFVGQLVQLSGIHWWRAGAPQLRQLPFRMSTMAFPTLIQQALVVRH